MIGKVRISDLRAKVDHRPAGYLDEFLSAGRVENDVVLHIDIDVYRTLQKKYSPPVVPAVITPQEGPGTELKKLLSRIGLKPAANCKCNQHIAEMNQKGIVWCEDNTDTIVGWLKEESERAKLPFTSIGARIIVRRAIRNSKQKGRWQNCLIP